MIEIYNHFHSSNIPKTVQEVSKPKTSFILFILFSIFLTLEIKIKLLTFGNETTFLGRVITASIL